MQGRYRIFLDFFRTQEVKIPDLLILIEQILQEYRFAGQQGQRKGFTPPP